MLKHINKKFLCYLILGANITGFCLPTKAASITEKEYSILHLYSKNEVESAKNSAKEQLYELNKYLTYVKDEEVFSKYNKFYQKLLKQFNSNPFFNRDKIMNYDGIRDDATLINERLAMITQEEREKERKELERLEQEKTEREKAERKEKLLREQDRRFKQKKEEFVSRVESIVKQIDNCTKNFSESDTFDEIVKNLKNDANNIVAEINDFKLVDDARNDDLEKFATNLNDIFGSFVSKVNKLNEKANELFEDIIKVKKKILQKIIDSAKDNFMEEVNKLEVQINDEFITDNLDTNDTNIINALKDDLLLSLKNIKDLVNGIKGLNDKANVEKEIKIFVQNKEKDVIRMNNIRKRADEKILLESKLESKQNFEKQLTMLRDGKLSLNQVIGGNENVIKRLDDLVDDHNLRLNTGKGTPSKGIILHGEPGVGKTVTAEAWAAARNYNLVILKRRTSIDMEAEIRSKFSEAKTLASEGTTSIILVDEIDAIGSVRIPGKTDKETVALMAEVDALKPDDKVIIVATTNLLSSVDKAVIRSGRIEQACAMPKPSDQEILAIVKVCIQGFKIENNQSVDDFATKVLGELRGMTGADIKRIFDRAVSSNMRKNKLEYFRDVKLTVADVINTIRNS